MDFQPSPYSFDQRAGSYEGWLSNLFTRKGRAENKEKRSKKKLKRGKVRGAERLERRADALRVKSSSRAMLTPGSDMSQLWRVKEPWGRRKRKVGSGLPGAAKGYRPSRREINIERVATIIGGVTSLSSAGIQPWSSINLSVLPERLKVKSHQNDEYLISLVAQTTGKPIRSLREASEEIREEVKKAKLEKAAWAARALPILSTAALKSGVTGVVAGSTGIGLGIAAQAAGASSLAPPWIQAIVTLPAAAILTGLSFISGGIAGGSKVRSARVKGDIDKYTAAFQSGIEEAGYRAQRDTEIKMREEASLREEEARVLAEKEGEELAVTLKRVAWVGGAGVGLFLTYLAIKAVRSRNESEG